MWPWHDMTDRASRLLSQVVSTLTCNMGSPAQHCFETTRAATARRWHPASLRSQHAGRQLIGVDISAAAIRDAKSNARRNRMCNATFQCLDLTKPEDVQQLRTAAPQVDVAIAGAPQPHPSLPVGMRPGNHRGWGWLAVPCLESRAETGDCIEQMQRHELLVLCLLLLHWSFHSLAALHCGECCRLQTIVPSIP